VKTRRSKTRRKEVTACQAPYNRPIEASRDPRRKKSSRSGKFGRWAGFNNLM
jgi:hypothetical protein